MDRRSFLKLGLAGALVSAFPVLAKVKGMPWVVYGDWELDAGDYLFNGDLHIMPGAKLIIKGDVRLIVNGKMVIHEHSKFVNEAREPIDYTDVSWTTALDQRFYTRPIKRFT